MPSLPITNVTPRIQYDALEEQTDFAVPFVFFYDGVNFPNPLSVYLTPAGQGPNDFDDLLTLNEDYTITQNEDYTGAVVLNVPAQQDDIITIVRAMDNQRLNFYITGGSFTANAANTDFESQVLFIQQNTMFNETVTPHYPLTSMPVPESDVGGGDLILPILGANQCWVKDPTDSYIIATDFNGGGGGGGVTWISVSTNTQMEANYGYAVDTPGTVVLTTPEAFDFGDIFRIALTAGTATVQLRAGQTIRVGNQVTSSGGTVTTQAVGDVLELLATSQTRLQVLSGVTHDFTLT